MPEILPENLKHFIIVTKDFSGLGFAVMLQEEGHEVIMAYKNDDVEPKDEEAFSLVGEGLVEKIALDDLIKKKEQYRDSYWIFDQNHSSDYSEKLTAEGFKIFGATEFMDKMEHDRQYATDIMKGAGLDIPETHEFSSIDEGLSFLEQHEDEAWVFKPDGDHESYLTFVPSNWDDKDAWKQLMIYMNKLNKDPGTYILQKRIKGIEINVEAWIYKGTPFFAFCCLENKRKLNRDAGCNVGCAQDIAFIIPLDGKLVQQTIAKTFPFYKQMNYTGFADVNIIIADRKFYFLEVCNRFGYNSHPNLFKTLAIDGFGEVMADFMDGKINGFYQHFRKGFGASIIVYNEHPRVIPIEIKEDAEKDFYHFDTFKENDDLLAAGYDSNVGIVAKHGWTMEEAARECIDLIDLYEEINFPDIGYRSDLHEDYGANSPIRRHRALQNMGLL